MASAAQRHREIAESEGIPGKREGGGMIMKRLGSLEHRADEREVNLSTTGITLHHQ